jgi:hypothetical protein
MGLFSFSKYKIQNENTKYCIFKIFSAGLQKVF